MADPKFPYVKWRDGRPRSSHGVYARALGFVDADLRHPPHEENGRPVGAWFNLQEASDFSATQLKISKTYEHTVGAKLKNEAQRLKDAGDPTDARQLIEAALKIPWPENSSYLGDLKDVLDQLNAASPTPAAQ